MSSKSMAGIFIIIILLIGGYYFLTLPDNRTTSQKVGDAIHDLDKGPDKAARQLEDRTPGQKLGDKIKDTGDDVGNSVKDSTSADHNN